MLSFGREAAGRDARLAPRAPFCPAPSQAALGVASSSPSPASCTHKGFGRRPRLPGQRPPGPARPLRTKSCDRAAAAEARRCRRAARPRPLLAAPRCRRARRGPAGRASGRRRAPGRRRAAAEPGRGAPAGLEGHLRPLAPLRSRFRRRLASGSASAHSRPGPCPSAAGLPLATAERSSGKPPASLAPSTGRRCPLCPRAGRGLRYRAAAAGGARRAAGRAGKG